MNVFRARSRLSSVRFHRIPATSNDLSRNREYKTPKDAKLYEELSKPAMRNIYYEETKETGEP